MDIEQLHNEVSYTAVTSSGAGGQHVNKVATKVHLELDLMRSVAFTTHEHDRLLKVLKKHISKNGLLRISCQESRSQSKNKQLAFKKLVHLLSQALTVQKSRRKTTVPKAVKRKRLNDKRKHSQKKQDRKFNY